LTITGGQLEINDQTGGTYTFGPGNLILAGTGFNGTGAIRPGRSASSGSIITITNNIVVQATTIIHSQTQNDISQGSITLTGNISGASGAQLQFTAPNSNNQIGTYIIQGANNTYAGGTLLRGGALDVSASLSSSASLGTGNVTIENNTGIGNARSVLILESGLTNAIANAATLSLAGGGTPGLADTGYVDLGAGINETIGGLILGGVAQPAGTYGATGTSATFINDEYFAGSGIITVAPSIPGDFDHNGSVNSADLTVWKNNFGTGNGADADGDGDSDGADFLVWQKNVGASAAVAAAAAVPEPAAAFLLTVAGLAAVCGMRKR
jgi:autotransporter-associated beta strand protein